ncbi:hypothetical protein ACTXMV_12370 [Psychrobacter celer]|uniref:hypothetical protein n=1 Tax=Psychrobacter TaxID=497 RepID=UPI003FD08C35
MKDNYNRNIKVTMDEVVDGEKRRSSTTLNYDICDYYFGTVLHLEDATKARTDKRYKDPKARYRDWLEKTVRAWAKQQKFAQSSYLERLLLREIYNSGYESGLDKNKDNLGLDL